jgi:hypothetical protein
MESSGSFFPLDKKKTQAFMLCQLFRVKKHRQLNLLGMINIYFILIFFFIRGAVCSPRALQSTEGNNNHTLPRCILIEKSRKFQNYFNCQHDTET